MARKIKCHDRVIEISQLYRRLSQAHKNSKQRHLVTTYAIIFFWNFVISTHK